MAAAFAKLLQLPAHRSMEIRMADFTTQRFLTPDGVTLVADVGGPPDAPTVILSHGGGQTRHSWSKAALELAARGYQVINVDMRGHGESDWAPDGAYTLEAGAHDLRTIIGSVKRPVALVGASMGGMLSFYTVATSETPSVDALILVDIVLRPAREGEQRIKKFMRGNPNGFATLDEAVDAVAAYNPARPRPNDPSGLMRNLRLRDDGRLYWHWDPRLLEAEPGVEPPERADILVSLAGNVTIPTLLVRGGQSDIVDAEGIEELQRLVPQTEILEVGGAGHMVAGDRNDAFNAGVIAFLEKHMPAK